MRILIVEDDSKIASFVTKGLTEAGFAIDRAADGEEGLRLALGTPYDAAVIDIMLPVRDGLNLIEELRRRRVNTPVIILSAKRSVDHRVRGLQAGGDDYLTKPFAFTELLERIRALIRRASGAAEPTTLTVQDLSLDLLRREVVRAGKKVDLRSREFALLEYLMRQCWKSRLQNDDPAAHLELQFRSPNQCCGRAGVPAEKQDRARGRGKNYFGRSAGRDMSLKFPKGFYRTFRFRLAVSFTVAFVLSSLIIFGFAYYRISSSLESNDRTIIQLQTQRLCRGI